MNNPNPSRHVRPAVWMCSLVAFGFLFCQAHAANAQVTGSGTINRIPKWSPTPTGLADSVIAESSSGNVGIGTTTPGAKLDVNGNLFVRNTFGLFSDTIAGYTGGATHMSISNQGTLDLSTSGAAPITFATLGSEAMRIVSGGNVGIGTVSPLAKLDIRGDSTFSFPTAGLARGTLQITPTSNISGNTAAITFGANDENGAVHTDAQAGIYVQSAGLYGTKMYFATTNNFGFGAQARMMVDHLGNVGIGTTNPSQQLHIHSAGTWAGTRVTTAGTGSTIADGVNFGYDDSVGSFIWNREATPLIFSTGNIERLRIAATGNVGIGTTAPTTKLHVAGNVTVKASGTDAGNITADGTISAGNVIARYQDVAEWVPASHFIPAGTVVVLDAEQSNHVLPSTRAYDTRVAGVVSAKPGVILGEGGEGKVMVATTGRIRVKVDATSAPIRVGDLLVTSDKEGVAMRSQPLDLGGTPIHRPGTLIGKALEPLEKGVGEILVLLSLQ